VVPKVGDGQADMIRCLRVARATCSTPPTDGPSGRLRPTGAARDPLGLQGLAAS
jgi:hypothetical protein